MITVNSNPATSTYYPVYNPLYFNVSSTNTAQPNFKYVFNVFDANSNLLSTVKLLPRPVTTDCIFNPSRVLESLLSYDKNIQTITAATATINHATTYSIDFGEEYGLLTTGTTVYTGLTGYSGFIFNGVLEYSDVPTWSQTWLSRFRTLATGGSGLPSQFMTNQPRSGVYVKNATDVGTVTSFRNLINLYNRFNVVVYHASGGSTTTTFVDSSAGLTTHIPTGPWNLNNAGAGQIIDVDNDLYYTVSSSKGGTFTEALTYLIDKRCNKYTTMRLMFLNRLGGFDYINFDLVSRKTINATRGTFKKNLSYNYSVGDRETTVIDINGTFQYQVTSNWLNNDMSAWVEELFTSNEVYMINSSGVAKPVIIQENSLEIQKTINNKMISYTFNLESSYGLNGQRA